MTTPAASDAARALVAHRPRSTFVCEVCEKEFEARVPGKGDPPRTCGATCRSTLHRREKKARAS